MEMVGIGMEGEVGFEMEIREIRECLTPGPLTLLSLSLKIQSLSLQALSLRESWANKHKDFKNLIDFINFFPPRDLHLYIDKEKKEKDTLEN